MEEINSIFPQELCLDGLTAPKLVLKSVVGLEVLEPHILLLIDSINTKYWQTNTQYY